MNGRGVFDKIIQKFLKLIIQCQSRLKFSVWEFRIMYSFNSSILTSIKFDICASLFKKLPTFETLGIKN